ncbi:hypothetical protein B7P43_G03305 [Cryptotermes secundus]|uniref:Uncharacterized protein n=1 Tax=Cryptotermes secundus TaxID=105785 RepID=A0A2J7PID9_9NEOP|nr:hypothetical protein B7P43_G03305 [Cryptotermes secundus]
MNLVCETYTRSPKKSTTRASLELLVPQKTVWNILRKRLRMLPYRLQLLQNLTENDKTLRHSFCTDMQQRNEASNDFFNPRAVVERVRYSPKVNVFCAVSGKRVHPCKLQGVLYKPCKYLGHVIKTLLSVKLRTCLFPLG